MACLCVVIGDMYMVDVQFELDHLIFSLGIFLLTFEAIGSPHVKPYPFTYFIFMCVVMYVLCLA